MRLHHYRFPDSLTNEECFAARNLSEAGESFCKDEDYHLIEACSITIAKKFLKKYGGHAWTEHYDRDGGLFETSDIKLKGNNSRFKYNHHL